MSDAAWPYYAPVGRRSDDASFQVSVAVLDAELCSNYPAHEHEVNLARIDLIDGWITEEEFLQIVRGEH